MRALVAQRARHEALAGFWTQAAAAAGLTTKAGLAAAEQSMKHGQRAERVAVTALDIAIKFAAARKTTEPTALDRIRAAGAGLRIAPPPELTTGPEDTSTADDDAQPEPPAADASSAT